MSYSFILFIDDDGDDRDLMEDAVAEISSDLTTMALDDAEEALEMIDGGEISPDLIVLDLNMPRMTGQEFLRQMQDRAHHIAIPVVVLSTARQPEIIEEVKALGAIEYFTKPGSFDEIKELMRQLVSVYH